MNTSLFFVILDQGLKVVERAVEDELPEHIRGDRSFATRQEAQAYLDQQLDDFKPAGL